LSIQSRTRSISCGLGVTTSSAFMRSIGTMRIRPPSGFWSRWPSSFSISAPTDLTSALCSVNSPADMPAIQSTSKILIVSSRCLSSRSVPEMMSRLRKSSARTACASLANGSISRSISRTLTYMSGTIWTEYPGGSARFERPSIGVTLPRTAAPAGTIR
jgi:hypothetical protein